MEHPLKEGEKYKITGGKYAKHKYCILNKVCPTFSDVNLCKEDGSVNTEIHKVKNCFLFVEPTIDMPDASQLQVVDASVDIDKLYEEQQAQKDTPNNLQEVINKLDNMAGDMINPSMNGMNETLEITEEDYEHKEFVEKAPQEQRRVGTHAKNRNWQWAHQCECGARTPPRPPPPPPPPPPPRPRRGGESSRPALSS